MRRSRAALIIVPAIMALAVVVAGRFPGVVGSTGLEVPNSQAEAQTPEPGPSGLVEDTLIEPPIIESDGAAVLLPLTANRRQVQIGDRTAASDVYNDSFIGPTVKVKPGQVLRAVVRNGLRAQPTNLHTHGLTVSPRSSAQGAGDNIFISTDPNQQKRYAIKVPSFHEEGTYWYHAHRHLYTNPQVNSGMAGMLLVEDEDGYLPPELADLKERVMILRDTQFTANGGAVKSPPVVGAPSYRTINGIRLPVMTARPGEMQVWRMANQSANTYYRLALDGHRMTIVARDGVPARRTSSREQIVFPPGARLDVLVEAVGEPGTYQFKTQEFRTPLDVYPEEKLADFVVQGESTIAPAVPSSIKRLPDLRRVPVDKRRVVNFTEDAAGNIFSIDNKRFDASDTPIGIKLGDMEEWTIRNPTQEVHVFHIHQTSFQVTEISGVRQPFQGYVDTVNLPRRSAVKIRIRYDKPIQLGKFVFHCHILEHEDIGMMRSVEVTRSGKPRPVTAAQVAAHSDHHSAGTNGGGDEEHSHHHS